MIMNWWQDIPTQWQDALIFSAYLLPVLLLATVLLFRLNPFTLIKTLLKRNIKINALIVCILGVCLSVNIAIQATTTAYKTAMAKIANRFELVITASGSKIDMMLATVYLQPVPTRLLNADIYERVARDNNVAIAAPIAYGDSYDGFSIVGSTNSFIKYLSNNRIEGHYFSQQNEAIIGAGVNLSIGDRFIPQHGIHKSFAPQYTNHEKRQVRKSNIKPPQKAYTIDENTAPTQSNNGYFCPDRSQNVADSSIINSIVKKPSHHSLQSAVLIDHREKLSYLKRQQANESHLKRSSLDLTSNDNKLVHHQTINVIGKMAPTYSPWDKAIITPVESVWSLHGLPNGHPPGDTSLGEPFDKDYFAGTPAILVHPKKPFQAYALSNKYTTNQSMAFRPPTVLAKLNAQLDDMTDILSRVVFVTIGLVLSLTIVTIALLGKLFEKHVQLLKSLGSPKRFIVSIMWGYVTLLALFATLLGCLLGYLVSLVLATYIENQLSVLLQIRFGWQEFTLCAIFFALTSVMGLIPACSKT